MKMLQFLMGGYYITLLVLLLITMALGVLMFRLCRKILRRVSKDMSHRAVNTWSTLGAIVLSPALVIGTMVFIIIPVLDLGVGYTQVLLTLLVNIALGVLMFLLFRKILRRVFKGMSDRAVNTWSTLGALPLTTAMGIVPYIMYISIEELPEELEATHYAIMEEELARDLKVGTSRKRIIELFGEADTTQSTMIYNLSLPEAINKYVLELHFDEHGLASFRRQENDSTPRLNK